MSFFDDPPYNNVDAALNAGYYGTGDPTAVPGSVGGDGGDDGTYNDGISSGGGINWNNILNEGVALGSQAIAGWSNNPTQQVGGVGVLGVGQGYSPSAVNQSQGLSAAQQLAIYNSQRAAGLTPTTAVGGVGLDATVNSLATIVTRNPLLVFGGIAALFLLYRQPPSSRR